MKDKPLSEKVEFRRRQFIPGKPVGQKASLNLLLDLLEEDVKEAVKKLKVYFMDAKGNKGRISILPSEYRAIINKIFGEFK